WRRAFIRRRWGSRWRGRRRVRPPSGRPRLRRVHPLRRGGRRCGRRRSRRCEGTTTRMPEGGTIFGAARTPNLALAGREILRFESVLPALTRTHEATPLTGRTVDCVTAAG